MAEGQGASLRELIEHMAHFNSRAMLVYQHNPQERDESIAVGMGKLLRHARRKAAGADQPWGTRSCP
jgi:hypothetical protein